LASGECFVRYNGVDRLVEDDDGRLHGLNASARCELGGSDIEMSRPRALSR
jgi:hypothetical protein